MAAMLVAGVKLSHAAAVNYGNISLQVTIGDIDDMNISLSADGGATWVNTATTSFGTGVVAFDASSVTVQGVLIRNESSAIALTYGLSGFDSDPWTIASAASTSNFAMQAMFNTTRPTLADFAAADDIFLADLAVDCNPGDEGYGETCDDDTYPEKVYATDPGSDGDNAGGNGAGIFEGDQQAALVLPGDDTRNVWIKFDAPLSPQTGGIGERYMTVGVLAQLP